MDKKLLDVLVCPICKGDRLAFPIRDDIPVMLEDEARTLAPDEEVQ
jgi:uncharacterized protein YbaR (Trm112 family)